MKRSEKKNDIGKSIEFDDDFIERIILPIPYKCHTQHDRSDQLFIQQSEGEVPLWDYNSVITWTIKSKTFLSLEHCNYAKLKTQEAISDWAIQGLDFRFVPESEIDNATFIVKYTRTAQGGTAAKAFFPVQEQSDLMIYPPAFSATLITNLKDVLSHEIGHIYGLRHEFAIRENDPAVQFGPSNPLSVMNYNSPPKIQPSDREWLQKLYDQANPLTKFAGLESFPIIRVLPWSGN